MDDLKLEDWQPMPPEMGPPLPRSMGITWPWYKVAVPLPEVVPAVPVVAPPVVPVIVAPPAAPPVIAYPPYPPVAYPPEAPPVIVYPPAPPPPEVPPEVPEKYRLFVSVVGKGTVSPKEGEYLTGTPVPLIATPAPGYEFDYWSGDVSGTSPIVTIMMDRAKTAIAHFKGLPPPELPPPKLPTVSILSASFTPSEATIGDVVSGTISWMPTMPGSPELFDFGISADLIDPAGRRVTNVLTASPTGEIGILQATPFSLDTRGLPEGWYGLEIHFSDLMTGAEIAKRSFLNLLHLLPLPEIPAPPPEVEISITAPDTAEKGETIFIYTKVTNTTEYRYRLTPQLFIDGNIVLSATEFIEGGASKTYGTTFYMPNRPVLLLAVVKYQAAAGLPWVDIDSASKTVTLAEVPEVAPPAVAPPAVPPVPVAPPPPEVPAPPLTEAELEAFKELALKVNIELGGSYVAGILTPPAGWVGSVTEWSRHVQAETLKRWLLGERA